MIITCKCGCDLTTDLYPTRVWERITGGYFHDGCCRVPRGAFIQEVNYWYVDKWAQRQLNVNPKNVIGGIVPKYRSGMGCCNVAWEPVRCSECGTEVGLANLDCYQDESIVFYATRVNRRYVS